MTPGVDADYVHEQYERVRREATTADPTMLRGHGLALFMMRGMSGWLTVMQTLVPAPPSGRSGRTRSCRRTASRGAPTTAAS